MTSLASFQGPYKCFVEVSIDLAGFWGILVRNPKEAQ
jgi:hypothetical protein